jgi:hypothetical protein
VEHGEGNVRSGSVTKIILPEEGGVPNLEIRRLMKEIEEERKDRTIHPQTVQEMTGALERLLRYANDGNIRGLALVALLNSEAQQEMGMDSLAIFSAPGDAVPDLYQTVVAFLAGINRFEPPPTPPA